MIFSIFCMSPSSNPLPLKYHQHVIIWNSSGKIWHWFNAMMYAALGCLQLLCWAQTVIFTSFNFLCNFVEKTMFQTSLRFHIWYVKNARLSNDYFLIIDVSATWNRTLLSENLHHIWMNRAFIRNYSLFVTIFYLWNQTCRPFKSYSNVMYQEIYSGVSIQLPSSRVDTLLTLQTVTVGK